MTPEERVAMDWKRLGMVVGARQLVLMLFGSTLKNTNGRAFLPESTLCRRAFGLTRY